MSLISKAVKLYDYFGFHPGQIIVEPTNACNLRCSVCFRGQSPQTDIKEGFIEPGLLEEILDKRGKRLRTVSLHFRGEPLLHPDIAGLVGRCKARGLIVNLSTNGLLLDEPMAKGLIRAGLDEITINCDDISGDDYEVIRGPDRAGEVMENITRLDALRRSMGSPVPAVVIKALNRGYSTAIIGAFVKRLGGKDVADKVRIGDCFPWPGIGLHPGFKYALAGRPRVCCMYYQPATITWEGHVLACSYDYREEFTLGRIGDYSTLDGIYRTPAYRTFRRRILLKAYAKQKPCTRCLIPLLGLTEGEHALRPVMESKAGA